MRALSVGPLLLLSLLLTTGCPTPVAGEDGGAGGEDASTDCQGQLGCACAAGACSTGECLGGTCVDCSRGSLGCVCRNNGTCNTGLTCSGSLCATCPAGQAGCACGPSGTCGTGLTCTAGTCAADTCTAGAVDCPCRGGDPKCDGLTYCDGMSLCRACSADVAGCPCGAGNACGPGLTCDGPSTTCRVPTTCASLIASGACAAHQTCTDSASADAVCVAASCEAEFKWDPRSSSCVACASAGCAMEPSCVADGGFADSCGGQHRACTQAGITAYCSTCLPGFTELSTDGGAGTCIPVPLCGAVTCAATEYCDPSSGVPTCQALPCAPGQARESFIDAGVGACQACNRSCLGEGFSGRIWPIRTTAGTCLCETLTGYFLPPGMSGQATTCDADHDGWVREEADDQVVRSDQALLANSRCAVLKVDRVRLEDEYGIGADVRSCTQGLLLNPTAAVCTGTVAMRLLETQRNDVPGNPGALTRAPAYGTNGRLLAANELNSLTKACVSLAADYDDNGVDDIAQLQPAVVGPDDRARLNSFAYFTELYSGFYEASGTGLGTLVIRERSRCDTTFPLRYDFGQLDPALPTDGYAPAVPATYWRNCARRRDNTYNQATPTPGFDFAQWTCPAAAGSCAAVPPAHPTVTSPTDPKTQALVRNYGLCALGAAKPNDMVWRGMGHHSQFKCVSVTATPSSPFEHLPADFATTSTGTNDKLAFNRCNARPCTTPGDPACTKAQGVGTQTQQPVVQCLTKVPIVGEVGFAAVGYRPYGVTTSGYTITTYRGGCVTEDTETVAVAPIDPAFLSYVCPYPEYSMIKADSDSAFGRYSCYGKQPNFLWAPVSDGGVVDRATLRYGVNAADTLNGFLR